MGQRVVPSIVPIAASAAFAAARRAWSPARARSANGKPAGDPVTGDAYQQQTFQSLGSRMKPGCVENSVVNGMLDMME